MKKLIILLVSVVALLSFLVGCIDNSTDNSTVEQKTESTPIANTEKEAIDVQTPEPNHEQQYNNLYSIVPDGWHVLERTEGEPVIAEGDLNKDSISDIATVIEKNVMEQSATPRSLLIAFGSKNNTYSVSIIAENVVMKADEGGVWGDPFDSLSIDRGSVLVSDYGGSNWRWYNKYRFRYQNNDWFLIGITMGSYFTGTTTMENSDEDDINLLTGDFIQRRTDEKGNTTTKRGNRGKKELIKLKAFNLDITKE